MGKYMIRVVTGDSLLAGSSNLVQLWLVGEHGEADLGKQFRPLRRGVSAANGWACRDCGTRDSAGVLGTRGRRGSLTPGMVSGTGGLTMRKANSERNRRDRLGRKRGEDETPLGCTGSLEPNRGPAPFSPPLGPGLFPGVLLRRASRVKLL